MRSHRLDRLARLTQGAALVGFGLLDTGCKKDASPTPEEPHMNATATPMPSVAPSDSTMPTINAPPTPPSAASTPDAAPPARFKPPMNAPNRPPSKP